MKKVIDTIKSFFENNDIESGSFVSRFFRI